MERKKILVTGGLGYIGSHTVISLFENGFEPVIIDNLSNSLPSVVGNIEEVIGHKLKVYIEELRDRKTLLSVFEENEFHGVIHFAASKYVGESVKNPLKYYKNNIDSITSLVSVMLENDVKNIVFSSSCSVYGDSLEQPVHEDMFRYNPPVSAYGHTKQIGESMFEEFSRAYGMRCLSLRYFNPAGAHESGKVGELPNRMESNLFPIMCRAAMDPEFTLSVFGNDYETKDGSCVRDFIHVSDLAEAHVRSLIVLSESKNGYYEIVNIGTGKGTTVLECINCFAEANGIEVKHRMGERRQGDVMKVWSSTDKSKSILGWEPKRNLGEICRSSFEWYKKSLSA